MCTAAVYKGKGDKRHRDIYRIKSVFSITGNPWKSIHLRYSRVITKRRTNTMALGGVEVVSMKYLGFKNICENYLVKVEFFLWHIWIWRKTYNIGSIVM